MTFYDQADRDFAARAQREDPALLRTFVNADINIASRDAQTNADHLRGLARYKYNMTGGRLALMLGASSLNDLLVRARQAAVYPGPEYFANITAKRDPRGDMGTYSTSTHTRGNPTLRHRMS